MPTTINASNTTGGAVVTGDGSGILELQSGGVTGITVNGANVTVAGTLTATGGISALTTPVIVTGSSTAGAEIRLPEDTDNGSNYVAIKAPNALAANLTLTLPTADGTNGQYLRTDGAGNLSFATVPVTSPGGTTGQIQINNAGAFGAVASGTSGQVLVSQGTGNAPTWSTNPFGATELYSVVAAGNTALVASPASITTGTFYSSIPLLNGTANTAQAFNNCPIWSKYYSCWFAIGYGDSGTSFYNIYYSRDGINWSVYVYDLLSKIGGIAIGSFNVGPGAGYANIIVDESNGRLWTFYRSGDGLSIIGYYKNAATGMDANWTGAGSVITLSNSASYYGARYVDTGTDATSAIALLCSNNLNDNRLYTCDAGGTTFTIRINGGTVNSANQPTSFTIDSVTGRAAILYDSQPYCAYMTTNNARTGWAYNSNYGGGSGSGTQCTIGVGGGYYVTSSGSQGSSSLYYSATGTGTWTTITNPCGGYTIQRVMYVNGVWYATTLNGMYKTSQNPPTTGWTQMNPSPRILGVVNIRTQA